LRPAASSVVVGCRFAAALPIRYISRFWAEVARTELQLTISRRLMLLAKSRFLPRTRKIENWKRIKFKSENNDRVLLLKTKSSKKKVTNIFCKKTLKFYWWSWYHAICGSIQKVKTI